MATTQLTVAATVQANTPKTWEYFTSPEHITQWNFASDDWHCPHATNDLRVGGNYLGRMEAKDGSAGFDFEAVYDEVVPEQRLSYTMADGRPCTTTFEDLDGATRVTTTFEAETMNPVELQQAGWQAILDNFKKYTEEN
jgi:uncharacterized protein YndB with AHSA1/START domain